MNRWLKRLFFLTFVLCANGVQAEANLKLSNWLPTRHAIIADGLIPWAREVEHATAGRVRIRVMTSPLGPPPAQFDLVRSGVADLGYSAHGYTPGRFVLPQLAELPFLSDSAEKLSVALWRLHESLLAPANEYDGVKLLSLFVHGPGQIFTAARQVTDLADFSGLKLRSNGGTADEVARWLGVVVVSSPAIKAGEVVASGIADGVLFPLESIQFFNLERSVRYGAIIAGGLYNTSFFVAMAQQKWAALSAADRKAIAALSGEALARRLGRAWDLADDRSHLALRQSGVKITYAPPEMVEMMRLALAPVESGVLRQVQARGIDADAALALLRAASQ